MKRCTRSARRWRSSAAIASLVMLAQAAAAPGQVATWDLAAPAEGAWQTATNWSDDAVPAWTQSVQINNGGTAVVSMYTQAASLGVAAADGSSGTLKIQTTMSITGGDFNVGGGSASTTSANGVVFHNGDVFIGSPNPTGTLNVGYGSAATPGGPKSTGTYTMTGGSLYSSNEGTGIVVGHGGVGTFNQSGGYALGYPLTLGRALGPTVTGSGTYNLSGGLLYATALQFGSAPSTESSTNTFNFTGGAMLAASIDILNPNANNVFNWTGGTLSLFSINTSITNNGGSLAPGDVTVFDVKPGLNRTTFYGGANYTQGPTGSLIVDIAAPGPSPEAIRMDHLTVDGIATMNGFIDVRMINGFEPDLGETFDVVTSSNPILGLPVARGTTAGGKTFVATPIGNVLRLTVVPEPSAALVPLALAGARALRRTRRTKRRSSSAG